MVGLTSNRRVHTVNQAFFDEWSDSMAYILGFIIADGNIDNTYSTIRTTIHEKDIEFLHYMQDEMSLSYEIKRYVKDKPQYATLDVSSKHMIKALGSYGVLHNKRESWDGFYIHVPEQYKPHIVRGFFDGDGWVFLKQAKNGFHLSTGFANKSRRWLEQIKTWVGIKGGYMGKRPTWYQLCLANRDSHKLRDYMYTGGFSLSRKRDKFFSVE